MLLEALCIEKAQAFPKTYSCAGHSKYLSSTTGTERVLKEYSRVWIFTTPSFFYGCDVHNRSEID